MSDSRSKEIRPTLTVFIACIALAATVGLVFVGFSAARLRVENALLQQHLELSDLHLRSQQIQLQSEEILTQAQLRNATTVSDLRIHFLQPHADTIAGTTACIIWLPSQRTGILFTENLPALSERQEYRLWIITASTNERLDCGAFQSRNATTDSPFQFQIPAEFPIDDSTPRFGVSIETIGHDSEAAFMVLSSS
jgi:hypothetical protein